MAVKKANKNNSKMSQAVVVFWLVFIIIIICVFMANSETIKKNFNFFLTRLTSGGAEEEILPINDEGDDPVITVVINDQPVSEPASSSGTAQTNDAAGTQTTGQSAPSEAQPSQTQPIQVQPQQPVRTTDRVVYFTQVNSDGQILQSRVIRRIPVTDSPMLDALNLLITGPSAEELSRGILNLIPHNTRILSAAIRGTTAYINFSEDFLFNTFGVEGYAAQLRQIIWTVTEFQTVNDVQILIEGRRMDYLGEGIWIGSPINRQSF